MCSNEKKIADLEKEKTRAEERIKDIEKDIENTKFFLEKRIRDNDWTTEDVFKSRIMFVGDLRKMLEPYQDDEILVISPGGSPDGSPEVLMKADKPQRRDVIFYQDWVEKAYWVRGVDDQGVDPIPDCNICYDFYDKDKPITEQISPYARKFCIRQAVVVTLMQEYWK